MADGGGGFVPADRLTPSGRRRSRTINIRRLSIHALERGRAEYPDEGQHADRPRTRGECPPDGEPCPWVSCKHHLYLDVDPSNGSIRINHPDLEVWELTEACALRVADREETATLEDVGAMLNITRERVRQIESRALAGAAVALVRHSADPTDVTVVEDRPRTVPAAVVGRAQAERALLLAGWTQTGLAGDSSQWRSPTGRTMSSSSALAVGRLMCSDDEPEPQPRAPCGGGPQPRSRRWGRRCAARGQRRHLRGRGTRFAARAPS